MKAKEMKAKEMVADIKKWKRLVDDALKATNEMESFFNAKKIEYGCADVFGNKQAFESIMCEALGRKVVEDSK